MVLDEATASIDPETETAVQNAMQEEFKNCTVLIIAHRLSTVTNCDRILVIERGTVRTEKTKKIKNVMMIIMLENLRFVLFYITDNRIR